MYDGVTIINADSCDTYKVLSHLCISYLEFTKVYSGQICLHFIIHTLNSDTVIYFKL